MVKPLREIVHYTNNTCTIILTYTCAINRPYKQQSLSLQLFTQRVRALAPMAGNALRYKSQNSVRTSLCSHHNKVGTRVHMRVSVRAADMAGDGVRHGEFGFTCGQVLFVFSSLSFPCGFKERRGRVA